MGALISDSRPVKQRKRAYSARGQPLPHADEIIALIEAGSTVAAACASDPSFPSWDSFVKHCRRDPVRASRLQAAFRQRQLTATDKATPRLRRVFTDAEYDDALQVIGSTTGPMKSALKPPMPTYMALWQRGDREPAFAELLRGAMASRKRLKAEHDHLEAEETEAARAHRSAARRKLSEKPVYATHVLASLLRANEFYVVAERAVPRHLDPWDRDDIKSELVCALIDGSISIDDAARSGKEFARQFMSRQSRHHCRSLDTSGYESDGEKWVDALSTDDVRIFL